MHASITRREAIAGLALVCSGRAFADAGALCPNDPTISSAGAPLTIDTHAHIFNGSDLQVRKFLSKALVKEGSELYPLVDTTGALLQGLAWELAPDARAEQQALARYAAQLKDCTGPDQAKRIARIAFEEGYQVGAAELTRVSGLLAQTPSGAAVLSAAPDKDPLASLIKALPPTYREFEESTQKPAHVLGSNPTLMGNLRFILHNFNYRHVNAVDYLTTYGKGSPRKVDLLVASMVDYDYWLADGNATKTTLEQQVALMGEISVLMGGRVHGFVPFCPFREAATRGADSSGQSLRLVKRAIESQGFIGVKLYPPMGFAAWGNSELGVWRGKPLPQPASEVDFGERLDASMRALFEYCIAEDVPVMAHSNHSNGPSEEFMKLAGSEYWKKALDEFKGLRVSFGHFGDSDLELHKGDKTVPFLKLMTTAADSPGLNTFADSGFFAGTLMNRTRMQQVLQVLYTQHDRVLLERLMYGTDWLMTLPQKDVDRYLADFLEVIALVERKEPGIGARGASLADAFFGVNAAEFLGLRKNRGNRRRLDAFYARNRVSTPDWMMKVDKL